MAVEFPSGGGTCHPFLLPTPHSRRLEVEGGGWRGVVTWRIGGAAFGFLIQRLCQRRRGEAPVSAGMNDELLKGLP